MKEKPLFSDEKRKRKRIIKVVVLTILIAAAAAAFLYYQHILRGPTDKDGVVQKTVRKAAPPKKKKLLKNQKTIHKIRNLPDSYKKGVWHGGKLREISYNTTTIDGTGRRVLKHAMVYLPPGYSENRKYNVFYLLHGYGATSHTFLGVPASPHPFKNILDNMIKKGDIEPLIVVTPTYTEEYTDYYMKLNALVNEVTTELMPAVETKYSTYAKKANTEGFKASRGHRAIGGFSMGGCTTWRALMKRTDCFKYYLPISMPLYFDWDGYVQSQNIASSKTICDGVASSGYGKRDYFIFAASGTKDFMCKATEMQARGLAYYKDRFTWTDVGFDKGNLMFHAWKGHKHRFSESYPYLYNGLIRFFHN